MSSSRSEGESVAVVRAAVMVGPGEPMMQGGAAVTGHARICCLAVVLWLLPGTLTSADRDAPSEERRSGDRPGPVPAEKLKEDLDFLFKTIDEVHPNMYAYTPAEEFATRRARLYQQVDHPMAPLEFYKLVAPVVASLKSGHTFMFPPSEQHKSYLRQGGKAFLLRCSWDGKRAILQRNVGPEPLPAGSELVKINGEDSSEVIQRLARLWPRERQDANPHMVMRSLPGFLWLEYGDVESLTLRLRTLEGEERDYVVAGVSPANGKSPDVWCGPDKVAYAYRYLPKAAAGLMVLNSFSDMTPEFGQFLESTFSDLRRKKATSLIIDLRMNPGGSSRVADALLQYLSAEPAGPMDRFQEVGIKLSRQLFESRLPEVEELRAPVSGGPWAPGSVVMITADMVPWKRPAKNPLRFKGRVYVLIGPHSISTSTYFAAAVQHERIGTLVGEETGDATSCYGNSLSFTLPNSALEVYVACVYLVYLGSTCDGRGAIPDHEVKPTPEDIARGGDTVLEFTLHLIKGE